MRVPWRMPRLPRRRPAATMHRPWDEIPGTACGTEAWPCCRVAPWPVPGSRQRRWRSPQVLRPATMCRYDLSPSSMTHGHLWMRLKIESPFHPQVNHVFLSLPPLKWTQIDTNSMFSNSSSMFFHFSQDFQ